MSYNPLKTVSIQVNERSVDGSDVSRSEDCWDEELSRFGQGKSCRPGIGIDTVSGAYVITRQIGLIRLSLLLFADRYRTL